MMNPEAKYWALVPAAGIGTRMGAELPKQYLMLGGKTILEQTLERLLQLPRLAGVLVVLNRDDAFWPTLAIAAHPKISTALGGRERADSVLCGLQALTELMDPEDWLLVHDAARPLLMLDDANHLIDELQQHSVGGLLGVPVSDTLKRVDTGSDAEPTAVETVDRQQLWHAQTPQLFRYRPLQQALTQALADGYQVTDEASALEYAGHRPQMVEGRRDNMKITRPEDMALAELVWQLQQEAGLCD